MNPGVKVAIVDDMLSSHELEIYPTTSLDADSIEFEFQAHRNVCAVLRQSNLALKNKLVKGYLQNNGKEKGAQKRHCFY